MEYLLDLYHHVRICQRPDRCAPCASRSLAAGGGEAEAGGGGGQVGGTEAERESGRGVRKKRLEEEARQVNKKLVAEKRRLDVEAVRGPSESEARKRAAEVEEMQKVSPQLSEIAVLTVPIRGRRSRAKFAIVARRRGMSVCGWWMAEVRRKRALSALKEKRRARWPG